MDQDTLTNSQIKEEANRIFKLQQAHQHVVAQTTVQERRQKLTRLLNAVLKYRTAIQKALYDDFKKPVAAVDLVEIYPVVSEIKLVRSNLKRWMSPQRVPTPLAFFGSRSSIIYEPKGVVLIIAPWNYPFQLTIGPLITAIAAGNCAILKPSEHTPNIANVMAQAHQRSVRRARSSTDPRGRRNVNSFARPAIQPHLFYRRTSHR
jgi:aldehyde dehydrogenase (NAD+)